MADQRPLRRDVRKRKREVSRPPLSTGEITEYRPQEAGVLPRTGADWIAVGGLNVFGTRGYRNTEDVITSQQSTSHEEDPFKEIHTYPSLGGDSPLSSHDSHEQTEQRVLFGRYIREAVWPLML